MSMKQKFLCICVYSTSWMDLKSVQSKCVRAAATSQVLIPKSRTGLLLSSALSVKGGWKHKGKLSYFIGKKDNLIKLLIISQIIPQINAFKIGTCEEQCLFTYQDLSDIPATGYKFSLWGQGLRVHTVTGLQQSPLFGNKCGKEKGKK